MTETGIVRQLRVRQVPVIKLTPYARNARKHPKKQIDQIAVAMREFGFLVPILIDGDGGIIAGHGRVLAAEKLGLAKVPTIQVEHLSETQKRAFILADNKLAEPSSWDEKLLGLEIGELNLQGFDLSTAGFSAAELKKWAPAAGGGSDDASSEMDDDGAAPAPPETPTSARGDLWLLGDHRVLCGDATSPIDAKRVIEGATPPNVMITDPPYGVQYDPAWRNRAERSHGSATGGRAVGAVEYDHAADWRAAFRLFKGAVAYIWFASLQISEVTDACRGSDFEIRAQIVWFKPTFVIGRGHYHWQHESCFYAVRRGKTANWRGDRKQTTVWQFANAHAFGGETDDERTGHSTQKPLEAMARPMRNHTEEGDAVYDPFLGSGTTLIAADKLGRVCYGLEIHPPYVDVIVERWQRLTGKAAMLDGDGRSFAEVRAARLGESEAA